MIEGSKLIEKKGYLIKGDQVERRARVVGIPDLLLIRRYTTVEVVTSCSYPVRESHLIYRPRHGSTTQVSIARVNKAHLSESIHLESGKNKTGNIVYPDAYELSDKSGAAPRAPVLGLCYRFSLGLLKYRFRPRKINESCAAAAGPTSLTRVTLAGRGRGPARARSGVNEIMKRNRGCEAILVKLNDTRTSSRHERHRRERVALNFSTPFF
ncbi:hypothetical protein EVAR_10026_1 [Eumeta japonica]|uniref:Uncharacterized protein n=1 Tax=Eumeta variegata TaxID=151549 RepID=A0A4C1TR64_EUMVA|nr:hypothetical protein EVAR_10026_1 [Eumeta japonica]